MKLEFNSYLKCLVIYEVGQYIQWRRVYVNIVLTKWQSFLFMVIWLNGFYEKYSRKVAIEIKQILTKSQIQSLLKVALVIVMFSMGFEGDRKNNSILNLEE